MSTIRSLDRRRRHRGRIVPPPSQSDLRCPGTRSEAGQRNQPVSRCMPAPPRPGRASSSTRRLAARPHRPRSSAVTYVGFAAEAKATPSSACGQHLVQDLDDVRADHGQGGRTSRDRDPPVCRTSYGWNCSGLMCIDAIANKKAGHQLDAAPDIVAHSQQQLHELVVRDRSGTSRGSTTSSPSSPHELFTASADRPRSHHQRTRLGADEWFNTAYADRATKLGPQSTSRPAVEDARQPSPRQRATSNKVLFRQCQGVAANGSKAAKLYAPSTWRQGSSYTVTDETTFRRECELVDDLRPSATARRSAPRGRSPALAEVHRLVTAGEYSYRPVSNDHPGLPGGSWRSGQGGGRRSAGRRPRWDIGNPEPAHGWDGVVGWMGVVYGLAWPWLRG